MADMFEISEDEFEARREIYIAAGYVPYIEKEDTSQNGVALDDTSNKVEEGKVKEEKQTKK